MVTNLGAVVLFDGGVSATEPPVTVVAEAVGSVDAMVVAVGAAVAAVAAAAFYAVPFAGLSLALGLTAGGLGSFPTSVAGFVLLVIVVVAYVFLVVASVAVLVQLPVRLFFRPWSLCFLRDVEEEYALIDIPVS